MKKDLILITGGAGFIGSHTADALAAKGYRVRILDNLQKEVHGGRWPAYLRGKGYELVRGDVRKRADLLHALRGVHYVYTFAAYQDQRLDFHTFFEVNTVGTALLYELIVEKKLPIKKVVLASSQFVYGDGAYACAHPFDSADSTLLTTSQGKSRVPFYPELRTEKQFLQKNFDIVCPHGGRATFYPFREDQPVFPTNSYGLSKHALEESALRLGKTYGIRTTVLRYSIVQGARQSPKNLYSGALRIFVTQALAGKPLTVYEDGQMLRDFVNIKDVVAANLLALKNKKTDFEIYNVGGGRGYRVLDFAELVKRVTHSSSSVVVAGFRRTDTRHAVSDISKLKKLGWRPRHTPEESIREYVAWLLSSL